MATIDVTITDGEYTQMMIVLNAMRAKLAPLKVPLAGAITAEPGKVKTFLRTEDGRFLREVWTVWKDLNTYMDAVGIGRGDG